MSPPPPPAPPPPPTRPQDATPTPQRRRGFSMAEMVVSLAVVAVLVGSMTSVLMLSLRAIDDRTNPAGKTVLAAGAVDQVMADLAVALTITERTERTIAFTVPDRNGDGVPETLRYSWSGEPGDPLIREYNGVADKGFALDVRELSFAYLLRNGPAPVEGATTKLMGHDDLPGGSMAERTQKSGEWCAQYLAPSLPANAVSWSISSIQLVGASHAGTDGVMEIQITTADAALQPTTTVLASTTFYESSLPGSHGWVTIPIGPLRDLTPGQGVCIVIRSVSGAGTLARWQYETNSSGLTPGTHFMTSNNSGSTWSQPNETMDLRFAVHGTVSIAAGCE